MWNGIKNFSSEFNATNIDTLDDLPESPDGSILVVIPYLEYSNEELAKIEGFVDRGGILLLMDDYGYGNSVLGYLGVSPRFTNKPLLDPLFCYKNQYIPRITDFITEIKQSNIDVIMLNYATTLDNVMEAEAIAWSSSASFLDLNENGSQDQAEPKGPFPVAVEYQLGKGRLAIISDPSIVINTMVDRDNNYDFITYLIRYKQQSGGIIKPLRITGNHRFHICRRFQIYTEERSGHWLIITKLQSFMKR
jgi:hypothetical protein